MDTDVTGIEVADTETNDVDVTAIEVLDKDNIGTVVASEEVFDIINGLEVFDIIDNNGTVGMSIEVVEAGTNRTDVTGIDGACIDVPITDFKELNSNGVDVNFTDGTNVDTAGTEVTGVVVDRDVLDTPGIFTEVVGTK